MDTKSSDRKSSQRPASAYRARQRHSQPRAMLYSARRYSFFVKFMKGALPLGALALGLSVLTYALQPREAGRLALTFERLSDIEGDLAMTMAKLTGTGDDGLPFVVTAVTAMQESRGSDTILLENVTADISLKDGSVLHVTAGMGVVDTKRRILDVSGGIRFTSSDGYDARTDSAVADLGAGTVHGESRIEADGKFGHITAQRFALDRDSRQLLFSGNVRMLLNRAEAIATPRISQ